MKIKNLRLFTASLLIQAFGLTDSQSFAQCSGLPTCATSGTISSDCQSNNLTLSGNLTVNPGVTVCVSSTLTISNGRTLTGTGATFYAGTLAETNGSTNTIIGGTFNVGSFAAGNGGDASLNNVTINLSPASSIAISNGAWIIDNSTFTGVNSWSVNVNSLSMTNTNVSASGSIQFEDATITGGTYSAGTSFSTTNGTNTLSGVNITAGTSASPKNASFTNSTLNVGGFLDIPSGNTSFNNSTVNSGTSNVGTNDATALIMNGGGILTLTNDTQMNIRGSVTNNQWYIDASDVVVTGDFDNAGSEILEVRNDGTINIGGDFNNSGSGNVSVDDGGFIQVDGDYDNSGGGSTDVNGGTFVVGGGYTGGNPTGDTGTCSGGDGGCCGAGCSTLPVTLIDFNYTLINNEVSLTWRTASELNNDYFTIEKSLDGLYFSELKTVPGNGTTNILSSYKYIDFLRSSSNFIYYRLSQTDFDGTHEVLGIVAVSMRLSTKDVQFYPNPAPAGGAVKVSSLPVFSSWNIYTMSGNLVKSGQINDQNEVELGGLSQGSYLLVVSYEGVRKDSVLVIR